LLLGNTIEKNWYQYSREEWISSVYFFFFCIEHSSQVYLVRISRNRLEASKEIRELKNSVLKTRVKHLGEASNNRENQKFLSKRK